MEYINMSSAILSEIYIPSATLNAAAQALFKIRITWGGN